MSSLQERQHVGSERLVERWHDGFGLAISQGDVENALRRLGERARPTSAAIRETVRGSPVINSDETGARVAGKTHWQWTFQTAEASSHVIAPSRGGEVIDAFLDGVEPEVWEPVRCAGSDLDAPQILTAAAAHQICHSQQARDPRSARVLTFAREADTGDERVWALDLRHVVGRAIRRHHERDQVTPETCVRRRPLIEHATDRLVLDRYLAPKTEAARLQHRSRTHRDSLYPLYSEHLARRWANVCLGGKSPMTPLASFVISLLFVVVLAIFPSDRRAFAEGAPDISALLASERCDKWASVGGTDTNVGTAAAPFKTPQKLATSLTQGQVGCFKGDEVFPADANGNAIVLVAAGGGTAESPVVLRSEPGAGMAEIQGVIETQRPDVVIAGLRLNGRSLTNNASAVRIRADRVQLIGNDITTEGTRICIGLGFEMMEQFGHLATDLVIDGNKIHHCGNAVEPGSGEHGIYMEQSLRAKVVNNYIYANQDRGIQVYFESDRAYIANNVIDRNGTNLSIGGRLYEPNGFNNNGLSNRYSDNVLAEHNILSNATLVTRNSPRFNVETFWARDAAMNSGTISADVTRNELARNCIYQLPVTNDPNAPTDRTWTPDSWGWSGVKRTGLDNFVGTDAAHDPKFQNQPGGDYRLQATSPCKGKGPLPSVVTGGATAVTANAATLGGTVNPHWTSATYYFEYGPTTAYGSKTPDQDAGPGVVDRAFTANLAGLTAGATYHYRIVARNSSGERFGANRTFTTGGGIQPPGRATLVSPSGSTDDTTPTYTWNKVPEATWYYLWVRGPAGDVADWYEDKDGLCTGTTCSVDPTVRPGIYNPGAAKWTLPAGAHQWWVQTWNPAGYGPWSTPMAFTVGTRPPPPATLVSPSGSIDTTKPAYTWNAVSSATWYYLWVNGPSGNVIQQWYTRDQAGCAAGTGTCSVTPTRELVSGAHTWWIQTWNPAGYGAWSTATTFTVGGGAPPPATPRTPTGTISEPIPDFTWSASSGATHYQVWVNGPSGAKVFDKTYTAAVAGCGGGSTTCTITEVFLQQEGAYTWWVRASNTAGGTWSTPMSFTFRR